MNGNILKRAIDELKSESPRIDYVLGMLETLYELQDTKPHEAPREKNNHEVLAPDVGEDEIISDGRARPSKTKNKTPDVDPELIKVPANMLEKRTKEQIKAEIIKILKEEPKISPNEIAIRLKVSPITVEKLMP